MLQTQKSDCPSVNRNSPPSHFDFTAMIYSALPSYNSPTTLDSPASPPHSCTPSRCSCSCVYSSSWLHPPQPPQAGQTDCSPSESTSEPPLLLSTPEPAHPPPQEAGDRRKTATTLTVFLLRAFSLRNRQDFGLFVAAFPDLLQPAQAQLVGTPQERLLLSSSSPQTFATPRFAAFVGGSSAPPHPCLRSHLGTRSLCFPHRWSHRKTFSPSCNPSPPLRWRQTCPA